MSQVLISSDGSLDPPTPCVGRLEKAGFEVRYSTRDFALGLLSTQDTIEQLRGASGVLAWGEKYTEEVLSALPGLRVIARLGVGLDSVNVDAATAHRVAVTISANSNHEAVAEHAMALMLAAAKDISREDNEVRTGAWPRYRHIPLRRRTLGIIGLGRIGRSVAVRAKGFGMNILAAELYPDKNFVEKHSIELVDLDTLLARSDYISLHCPLIEETRGLINRDTIAKMKPGVVLVNTARGGLQVEKDLIGALESGHIRAAGLDVFEQEPPSPDNPLLKMPNVVATPHTAGIDTLSIEEMGLEAAQCIIDLSKSRWPSVAVNKELESAWRW